VGAPARDVVVPAIPAGQVTALLVDADRSFVQFAREELNQTRGQPVRLLHAATLAEAGDILAAQPVAVVLLDRTLLDGDGLEWLKTRRPQLKAGVVVLLGESRVLDQAPIASGAHELLIKAHLDGNHLAGAIRCAAERERTRQDLLQSREHFQSLIEHARDLITVVDESGQVVYQSPAAATLLGTPPHTHHGASFAELVHPEESTRARRLLDAVFASDETLRGEFRLPHADGSMRTFEVVASRMRTAAGERRAVLNARDISERCRAEEALRLREGQLQQAQKMEAVGRLAGGIAHDFSNILTVIAGACERLQEDIAKGRAEPGQVQVVLRHCARATALTRQLLAFSRLQTIAPRVLDLGQVVRRSSELITQLTGTQVRTEIDVAPDLRPIEADPVQIEQVLMNLAINARDAMSDRGGVLQIVVRNVEITPSDAVADPTLSAGSYVRLDVSDNGHGMSGEVQARAFEPFFTTKDSTKGTGLGLATVYGIVTQNRGRIRIDSAVDRGTRFEIHLPASTSPPQSEPMLEESDGISNRTPEQPLASTILIAEDDPDLRGLLSETLLARGYTVVEAGGPDEAVTAISAEGPQIDLLLTDLIMPGGSGRDLARRMRVHSPRLKVLYMSGYGEPGTETGALLAPGDPFLAKPFTRQQLLSAIGSLLGTAAA
jgi:two-component system cell cycle sensor histidine kinase/response regulator CckA